MSAMIRRIGWTAETQHGYITRAQALADGASDVGLHRAAAAGVLERVGHGVYRVVGAQEHPHHDLWVAWLQLDPAQTATDRTRQPTVWVSHRSAARVLDLGVLPADVHEFSSLVRRQSRRGDVRVHRRDAGLPRTAWRAVDGMAVTGPATIIADLLAEGVDGGHVGSVAVDALTRGLVTDDELIAGLADRPDPSGDLTWLFEQATSKFTRL